MAVITDLELNTSSVDSRPIINTNFDNLNTDKAELSGATYTGDITFNGTTFYGVKLNSLTTAQRDALAASNGYVIYNSTNNQVEFFQGGAWTNLSGVADATVTVKGVVEEATEAEVVAGTAAGGTSARLFVNPSSISDKILTALERTLVRDVEGTTTATEINQLAGTTNIAESDTFFNNTNITGAEAETLTDGSNADALHVHTLPNAIGDFQGYFTSQLNLDSSFWTSSNVTHSYTNQGYVEVNSSNNAWFTAASIAGNGADDDYRLDDGKNLRISFRARAVNGVVGDRRIGFGAQAATRKNYNDATDEFFGFGFDGGTAYAVSADAATATTEDVSAGITITNWNTYRLEYDAGSEVRYYVNNSLVSTISANLIGAAAGVGWFGIGGTLNTEDWQVSDIVISQEL